MWADLKKQLAWFEKIGVDKFNFSVLTARGMINHSLPRPSGQVLAGGGWGWVKNREGLNVYLRASLGIDQPVIFLDDLQEGMAAAVARKYNALVLETSKNNHQVWIQTDQNLSVEQRFNVQKLVAAKVGADPGSTSGDHFGRAAGFFNRKPGRENWPVRVVVATTHCQPLNIGLLEQNSSKPEAKPKQTHPLPAGRGECASGVALAGGDESRREFGWACGWLRAGRDVEEGVRRLAARAAGRGKRQEMGAAEKYARQTFKKAASAVA